MVILHERRQYKPACLYVVLFVRIVVVSTNEIGDVPVLIQYA